MKKWFKCKWLLPIHKNKGMSYSKIRYNSFCPAFLLIIEHVNDYIHFFCKTWNFRVQCLMSDSEVWYLCRNRIYRSRPFCGVLIHVCMTIIKGDMTVFSSTEKYTPPLNRVSRICAKISCTWIFHVLQYINNPGLICPAVTTIHISGILADKTRQMCSS